MEENLQGELMAPETLPPSTVVIEPPPEEPTDCEPKEEDAE
jgi:hypothetical protein